MSNDVEESSEHSDCGKATDSTAIPWTCRLGLHKWKSWESGGVWYRQFSSCIKCNKKRENIVM